MKKVVCLISALYGSFIYHAYAQFSRITSGHIGTDAERTYGVSWVDYDKDGDLDLLFTNSSAPDRFYRNDNGNFTFLNNLPFTSGSARAESSMSNWGDFDNDGNEDVFIGKYDYKKSTLHYNYGDGTFLRLNIKPIGERNQTTNAATWVDYDNDGDLDLLIANEFEANMLFANLGNGQFEEVVAGDVANFAGKAQAIAWGDYDNDGDLDLFIANHAPDKNLLFKNNNGVFRIVEGFPLNTDIARSTSASWGDYDNDGDLDLFVANLGPSDGVGEPNFLYRNDGNDIFTKITTGAIATDANPSRGSAWADYDNDGDIDLFVQNDGFANVLYINNGNGTFTKSSYDWTGSHGIAFADFDNDGFLDFASANRYGSRINGLYKNTLANGNKYLFVKPILTETNRSGIGVIVKIKAAGKWQMRQITASSGYCAQGQSTPHFGVGTATIIDSVMVYFPTSGKWVVLTNVSPNQTITVREPRRADYSIRIGNNFYDPDTLTIRAGEVVEFVWIEGNHPTVSTNNKWPTFTLSSTNPIYQISDSLTSIIGQYPYYCQIHGTPTSGMGGQINVIAADTVVSAPEELNAYSIANNANYMFWLDKSMEDSFMIERSLYEDSAFVQIGSVRRNQNFFTDNTALPNTVYFYRVRAKFGTIYSPYSNVKRARTSAIEWIQDSLALVALYDSTKGIQWYDQWDLTEPFNTWIGVTTNEDRRVTSLRLRYNDLDGKIPPQLGNLTELERLDLSKNFLKGSIPSSLGRLTKLKRLYLDENELTGTIPDSLGLLPELEDIILSYNRLTGTIPNTFARSNSIQYIEVSSNQLSGSLPDSLGYTPNLVGLYLDGNNFSGSIPVSYRNLTRLQDLYLSANNLSGNIPLFLGSMTSLVRLYLDSNQFVGTIPDTLRHLTNLERLYLNDNQLTGTIPSWIGNLTQLRRLFLDNNQLSGQIPTSIGNLSILERFYVHRNQLSGEVPSSLVNLPLERLLLHHNQFTKLPDFSNVTSLDSFSVAHNRLTFTSIYPNLNKLKYPINYAPQAKVTIDRVISGTAGGDYVFNVPVDTSISRIIYTWTKNGVDTTSGDRYFFRIERAQLYDTGIYVCLITHPDVPGLTLSSGNFEFRLSEGAVVTGLNKDGISQLFVYPNPFSDYLIIEFEGNIERDATLVLYDVMGTPLWKTTLAELAVHIPTENLPKGFYLVKIQNGTQTVTVKRLIKK
ncbi:MAG: FG-GAP-like repeat-containing protein [Cytophagales bacterium]|nr:FG-GAP-like repeat-containing protein [Cytophagales bacterium]MDW8384073.1 FG-GAP-like repeat-containing protein [Flammeovirgaceae bacterium]